MNFYNLKLKFKDFLIDQGISSTKINLEKDLDNINLFTFGSEFQNLLIKNMKLIEKMNTQNLRKYLIKTCKMANLF